MKRGIQNLKHSIDKHPLQVLAVIVLFGLLLRLLFFYGIGSSDSLFYAENSYYIATEQYEKMSSQISARIGIVFPVSVLYSVFGVNDWTSNLIMIVFGLGAIVMSFFVGKLLFSKRVGLLAAFLMSFFPLNVAQSTRLSSDIGAGLFVTLGVYLFLKAEQKHINPWLYVASGLSIGVAYLMKELSLLIGLFFLAYALYTRKIRWVLHGLVGAGVVLMIISEMLYFGMILGNPLYHYTEITGDYTTLVETTNNYGRGDLPWSLVHYPYLFATDHHLGLFYVLFFFALFWALIKRKKELIMPCLWTLPVLTYIAVGSIQLTSYVPLPAAARFLSVISVPVIVIIAYFLLHGDKKWKVISPMLLILLIVTSFGLLLSDHTRTIVDEERALAQYVIDAQIDQLYTDQRTARILEYQLGFEPTVEIISYHRFVPRQLDQAAALDLSTVQNTHVAVNHHLIEFLQTKEGMKLPLQVTHVPEEWTIEQQFGDEQGITLYSTFLAPIKYLG